MTLNPAVVGGVMLLALAYGDRTVTLVTGVVLILLGLVRI
jgi:hypothetical protein